MSAGTSRPLSDRGGVIALDLSELVAPEYTALVTVEVQEGVVGAGSVLPAIAEAAAAINMVDNIATLARAARAADVAVIHCTAESRPDGLGASRNAKLFAIAAKAKDRGHSLRSFQVHAGVGVEPSDLILSRLHGLSPMTGTSLDPVLRNLGVRTIVATGVSVNVALLGLAFEAVNHGYQVVIPRDAVAGVDERYVDAVFANTLSLIATVTTVPVLVELWGMAVS
jgi:nicotinamidase-related amidase